MTLRILIAIAFSYLLNGCAGYNVKVGASYRDESNNTYSGYVELDPSFAKQKK